MTQNDILLHLSACLWTDNLMIYTHRNKYFKLLFDVVEGNDLRSSLDILAIKGHPPFFFFVSSIYSLPFESSSWYYVGCWSCVEGNTKASSIKKENSDDKLTVFELIYTICQFISSFLASFPTLTPTRMRKPSSWSKRWHTLIRRNLRIDYFFDDCTDWGNLSSHIPQFIRAKVTEWFKAFYYRRKVIPTALLLRLGVLLMSDLGQVICSFSLMRLHASQFIIHLLSYQHLHGISSGPLFFSSLRCWIKHSPPPFVPFLWTKSNKKLNFACDRRKVFYLNCLGFSFSELENNKWVSAGRGFELWGW